MYFAQGDYIDGIVSAAAWAASVATIIKMGGSLFGIDENKVNAVTYAAMAGVFAGQLLHTGIKEGGWMIKQEFINEAVPNAGAWSAAAGVGVATLIFLATYKSEDTETKTFTCDPWQAPTGGTNCEKCNKGNLPCSEYQCRSLGQSCQLLNPGTDEENCAGVWEMERELERELEKEGISVWFEEINLDENKEISDFIYATEYENKTEYMKCQVTDEYDDYFKDAPPGVYLIFNDEGS